MIQEADARNFITYTPYVGYYSTFSAKKNTAKASERTDIRPSI
ncbi:hypothetical protein NIES267_03180 [Calothrix parasitica NIES-267]|uniref:Uncharacterized protein n=1 Tax=Calothrix parasitica NIES-267 TaxID=1973488 RepID=A0A1Z4LHZ6_9CYAN|nr:hypothetical protein NIES267_03180 [Calothrix parasitica NIES-267]